MCRGWRSSGRRLKDAGADGRAPRAIVAVVGHGRGRRRRRYSWTRDALLSGSSCPPRGRSLAGAVRARRRVRRRWRSVGPTFGFVRGELTRENPFPSSRPSSSSETRWKVFVRAGLSPFVCLFVGFFFKFYFLFFFLIFFYLISFSPEFPPVSLPVP